MDMDSPGSNLPLYSVSELAGAVRRTIEDGFGQVRVRGEVGRVSRARSGHIYTDLKDADAVLSAVCWRGQAGRLAVQPEEGLEVIATGRLTTFPGQSRYQLVIESLELAGEGALLRMIEERKRKLAGEGLFDAARKRPLPMLPRVVGLVTSATGAAVRDVLRNLEARCPTRVILWPTLVQGQQAPAQIAAAVRGFGALDEGGRIPRPDVLIVGRGGGSLEDLMAFNEEIVVRAIAESPIPVISAVGHEIDTSLADLAADLRAATPTEAAVHAVPVRAELLDLIGEQGLRLSRGLRRRSTMAAERLEARARALSRPQRLLDTPTQRLDHMSARFDAALKTRLQGCEVRLNRARDRLGSPRALLQLAAGRLDAAVRALPKPGVTLREAGSRLAHAAGLLEAYSHQGVLQRGFVLVLDTEGRPIKRASEIGAARDARLRFHDDEVAIRLGEEGGKAGSSPRRRTMAGKVVRDQGDLF